jgi:hypothetical protein
MSQEKTYREHHCNNNHNQQRNSERVRNDSRGIGKVKIDKRKKERMEVVKKKKFISTIVVLLISIRQHHQWQFLSERHMQALKNARSGQFTQT